MGSIVFDFPDHDEQARTQDNFAFVMNIRSLGRAQQYELAPGFFLRKATREEVATIRKTLELLISRGPGAGPGYLWEGRLPHLGTINQASEDEWRYFVIAFRGENSTLGPLASALDVATLELEVGFTIYYRWQNGSKLDGCAWNEGRLYHVLSSARMRADFFVDVTPEDAHEIAQLRNKLESHDREVIDVYRLARRLAELKAFPHNSPLRFLGYFAVLESLLTHAPKPSDPYDSITRQVKEEDISPKQSLVSSTQLRKLSWRKCRHRLVKNVRLS